ncbi:MAG: hypothetical protein ACLUI3_14140 [Christensenellales bacterium]
MRRHARRAENPAWVSGFHYAHAYPAKEKPQWARGCVGYQIFPDRFRRVDVPGGRRAVGQQARGERISLRRQPRGIWRPCRIWPSWAWAWSI